MTTLPTRITLGDEVTVSRLGYGTIHVTEGRGFGAARKNAVQLLRRAVEFGVDFIDTADSYGPGTAEDVICEALYPYTGVTIATKGGFEHPAEKTWIPNGQPDHLRNALDGSLRRLKLDRIPLYYLHVPDQDVEYGESVGFLKDMCDAGKIQYVGISNVDTAHVLTARNILGDSLVSVQNYYNVMFHHGANNFYPETEDVLDECELREWAFVAWEPMGTGEDFPDVRNDEPCRRAALDSIEKIASELDVSRHVVRLAAVLSRSEQIIAIPGTSNLNHLEANMVAMELSEKADFDKAWLVLRS